MNILVTGGSGLVGKYIVRDLIDHGHTVGVLDLQEPAQNVKFHRVDVLSLDAVTKAFRGYDAVVHMAGIPHPLNDPAERVFYLNVNGTFNVLEAAARTNIRKVVFTSSESTLGFAFMKNRMVPEYFPLDEFHPLRPQDPYGLSKVIGEQICRTYTAQYGIRTVCLREPWIWVPEEKEIAFYKQLVADYPQWHKNLWTYVHVNDVTQAHRLALEKDLPELHDFFFITGGANWPEIDARELAAKFYPEVKRYAVDFTGPKPLISHAKAAQLLGYKPAFSRHDLF